MAVDVAHHRAVLLSAKGIERSPGEEDVVKLVNSVESVRRILGDWQVHGIIVSHASATQLLRLKDRRDVGVWGQDELAMLLRADTRDAIEHLLWTLPGWPGGNIFVGHP